MAPRSGAGLRTAKAPTGIEPVFVASVVILVYVRRSPASPAIASRPDCPRPSDSARARPDHLRAHRLAAQAARQAGGRARGLEASGLAGFLEGWRPTAQAVSGSAFVGDVHPGHGSRLGACYSRKREGTRPAPFQAKKCPPGMDADMPLTRPSQNRQPTSKPATRGTAGWKTPTGRPAGRSMILSSLRVCLFARTAAKGRSDGGPNYRRLTARANS